MQLRQFASVQVVELKLLAHSLVEFKTFFFAICFLEIYSFVFHLYSGDGMSKPANICSSNFKVRNESFAF